MPVDYTLLLAVLKLVVPVSSVEGNRPPNNFAKLVLVAIARENLLHSTIHSHVDLYMDDILSIPWLRVPAYT